MALVSLADCVVMWVAWHNRRAMRIIQIDGPPGAGKSTILEELRTAHKMYTFPEPRHEWDAALQRLDELRSQLGSARVGTPQFTLAQSQYELALVHLQTMVLCWFRVVASVLEAADSECDMAMERSPQSAKVFHALAGDCSEACKAQLDEIAKQLPVIQADVVIDLRLDPALAAARVQGRGLAGDKAWTPEAIAEYYAHYDTLKEFNAIRIAVSEDSTTAQVGATIIEAINATATH